MLEKKKSNYAIMYKEIGMSHETLQTALKYFLEKKFIRREDKGHKKSFYEITEKGKKYSSLMKQLKELEN